MVSMPLLDMRWTGSARYLRVHFVNNTAALVMLIKKMFIAWNRLPVFTDVSGVSLLFLWPVIGMLSVIMT